MIPRAGRIAARLAIEFAIAHVSGAHDKVDSVIVESSGPKRVRPTWSGSRLVAEDVPKALLDIARSRPETTIALAGTKRASALARSARHFREDCSTPELASCSFFSHPATQKTPPLPPTSSPCL